MTRDNDTMPTGVTQLKPCPLCKGQNVGFRDHGLPETQVGCNDCGLTTRYYESRDEAITAWNTRPSQSGVTQADLEAAADKDCHVLDAGDFQVGAVAKVVGHWAAEWPEPVRIIGIEKYRTGKVNITIGELDGGAPTDGFGVDDLMPDSRYRLSAQSTQRYIDALKEGRQLASEAFMASPVDFRKGHPPSRLASLITKLNELIGEE